MRQDCSPGRSVFQGLLGWHKAYSVVCRTSSAVMVNAANGSIGEALRMVSQRLVSLLSVPWDDTEQRSQGQGLHGCGSARGGSLGSSAHLLNSEHHAGSWGRSCVLGKEQVQSFLVGNTAVGHGLNKVGLPECPHDPRAPHATMESKSTPCQFSRRPPW